MILSRDGFKIKKKDIDLKIIKKIREDLTVKPFVYNDYNNTSNEKRFTLYLESPKKLYLPRFYGIDLLGDNYINKIDEGDYIDLKFNGSLRKEQLPIADLYTNSAKKNGGGIISLKCGGGKTVLALYIISLLKKKTVVVVHKDFLMTQWRERIEQFLPDAKIGKIQQNTVDIEGKDIVLAMVQSLSMKEYPDDTFNSFGFAVFDECHHLGAEVFSKAMPKVASKYMLGLSATPNRKDGLRKVFEWYIGPMVYISKDKDDGYVEVNILSYISDNLNYCKEEKTVRGDPCIPRMINNICDFEDRNIFIYNKIKEFYNIGRKILILTDRRNHILNLLNKIQKELCNVGLYVGGMKPEELKESQNRDIILGTFSMASEGMDVPKLNTVILASPKSDVEQSVGRIFREKAENRKFHPLIIDIQDNFSLFQKQSDKRLKLYKKNKYDIFMNGEKYIKKNKKKLNFDECLIK